MKKGRSTLENDMQDNNPWRHRKTLETICKMNKNIASARTTHGYKENANRNTSQQTTPPRDRQPDASCAGAKSNVCQQKNTCANKPRASVHFHSSSNSSAPMKVTLPPAQPGNAPREQPSAQPEGAPSSCWCLGPGCKESNNYDCTMRNNISNN